MREHADRFHDQQRALYELAMAHVMKARALLAYAKLRADRLARERERPALRLVSNAPGCRSSATTRGVRPLTLC